MSASDLRDLYERLAIFVASHLSIPGKDQFVKGEKRERYSIEMVPRLGKTVAYEIRRQGNLRAVRGLSGRRLQDEGTEMQGWLWRGSFGGGISDGLGWLAARVSKFIKSDHDSCLIWQLGDSTAIRCTLPPHLSSIVLLSSCNPAPPVNSYLE